ncbi:MAG: ferrous iron transport protein B [Ruminococcaceae bacterium]|nr:ferrous iron transport protein B [Oscillospiraceae bacterium]
MIIALTGNPNSGKTTMFNALTGSNEKVGNWAGVTVDKKTAHIKKNFYDGNDELIAVDLPGAYSMSPFTSEESITSSYIKNEAPDVIVNIVDATNVSRSLFFTTQILELGIPVVVALNKSDVNKKKRTKINTQLLSEKLGCPVVETTSTTSHDDGLKDVIKKAIEQIGKTQIAPYTQDNADLTSKELVIEADKKRFAFVNKIVSEVETRKILTKNKNSQDKIDAILTNQWLGIPIFAVVMFAVFWISQAGPGVWIADALVALLEEGQAWIGGLLEGANPLLYSLLVDGIVGGVIAVIGFLPLVMVMYFFIALLEDCGYMARVSVVLDPIFKKVGLSGRSVIPFVIATGCAIPGVMACRTVRNERERRATAMLAPFMPCGAKLPVISLFAGAFFGNATWVGPLMYFAGIIIIFFGALIVNKIAGYKAKKSYFIIELPEYKIPNLWRAFKSMCGRGWEYIVKAATIILICNTAVQVMQTFDWSFKAVAENAQDTSILASIATPFAYVLIPIIGYHCWQLAAAAITGFIAKENVVGTLAVCFSITNLINAEELSIIDGASVSEIATKFGGNTGVAMTAVAGLAYLIFNLFTPPCFAAIGAMNAEINNRKWFWSGIALQFSVGYTVSYFVYTIGTLITAPETLHVKGALAGGIIVAAIIAIITYLCINGEKNAKIESKVLLG